MSLCDYVMVFGLWFGFAVVHCSQQRVRLRVLQLRFIASFARYAIRLYVRVRMRRE